MNPPRRDSRSEVRRLPDRAHYDRDTVHSILDEGTIAHIGFAQGEQPFVIPTSYVRIDDCIYLHGSPASRMLRDLAKGVPVCVTVTHLDGLVLARSSFHHSMNYRSVVVFGTAREVQDLEEKRRILNALVEHIVPGRVADARGPNTRELQFTKVLKVPIEEASAKVRAGGPNDDPEDLEHPAWAGVIPLTLTPGEPIADTVRPPVGEAPGYVKRYRRGAQSSKE